MPQMDAALVAIAHRTADVSSMAGLPAQLITNALLGLGHAARAQPVWPGDSGPVSTKSQRTGRIGVISDSHGLLRPEVEQRLAGVDNMRHACEALLDLRTQEPVTVRDDSNSTRPL